MTWAWGVAECVHRWKETGRRFRLLTLDSVDDQGVGHRYKWEDARRMVCEVCQAVRVEFMREGAWYHSHTVRKTAP